MIKKITESISSVGILNPNMRVFDIVMSTEYGTTYNSYIVKGSEKTALIECCHKAFFKDYVENIKEACPLEKIDYVILNHNEPDHTGAMAQLLELCPQVEIITTQSGSRFIQNITNRTDLKIRVVKDGETLTLGDKTLKFIIAPFLHWPDSMFTWIEEEKALFSCDFFGSHYCEPQMIDTSIAYPMAYEISLKGYYDAIFGPFPTYVQDGLKKIEGLDIAYVCASHGPVLTKDGNFEMVRASYNLWSTPVKNDRTTIPIFYCSAYGNTRMIAEEIKKGILSEIDADCELYDIIEHPLGELQTRLNRSDAFAIGTPTLNRDAVPPVWDLLGHMDAINNQKKPCLVFGSFGWSGEGVPNVIQRLESLKLKVFGQGMKVMFVPSEKDLEDAKELGREFAKSLS